jgi:hypothetical protein
MKCMRLNEKRYIIFEPISKSSHEKYSGFREVKSKIREVSNVYIVG